MCGLQAVVDRPASIPPPAAGLIPRPSDCRFPHAAHSIAYGSVARKAIVGAAVHFSAAACVDLRLHSSHLAHAPRPPTRIRDMTGEYLSRRALLAATSPAGADLRRRHRTRRRSDGGRQYRQRALGVSGRVRQFRGLRGRPRQRGRQAAGQDRRDREHPVPGPVRGRAVGPDRHGRVLDHDHARSGWRRSPSPSPTTTATSR